MEQGEGFGQTMQPQGNVLHVCGSVRCATGTRRREEIGVSAEVYTWAGVEKCRAEGGKGRRVGTESESEGVEDERDS